jgi:hypothetical protein
MMHCIILVILAERNMEEVIDRIMNSEEINQFAGSYNRIEIKAKIGSYIATLSSAGQRDPDRLTEYGLAYVRELQRGPDYRYTGC